MGIESFKQQSGFSLIEALVAIVILTLLGLGLTKSMILTMKTEKLRRIKSSAEILAKNQLEIYSMINPNELDNTYDDNETGLTYIATNLTITYNRVTDVTINADNSKTVGITVTCEHPSFTSISVDEESTFSEW